MNTLYDFAYSAQGYHHIKADKVCQDASAHYSDESMAVIVVADGHGSDNYPRTDRGSRYAAEAAIRAIREFVKTVEDSAIELSADSEVYLEMLAKNILANWYAAVEADLTQHPFSEEELTKVSEKYKRRYLSGERQEKAYGTTLIAACQTKEYWFGLQIGDGKCVCIFPDGSMAEPIPWDEDCQANVTTSICDADAIHEFRFHYTTDCPIATLMGTDGIDDSYAGTEELYVLYRSVLAIFAEHGRETGEEEIRAFLPGLSRGGSGDDVSIAGILSATLSDTFLRVLKAQSAFLNAKAGREQAERELVLAVEKQEYIRTALKNAQENYELCLRREADAQTAIHAAQNRREEAYRRLEAAEAELCDAKAAYHRATMPIEPAPDAAMDADPESVSAEEPSCTSSAPPQEAADEAGKIPDLSSEEENRETACSGEQLEAMLTADSAAVSDDIKTDSPTSGSEIGT